MKKKSKQGKLNPKSTVRVKAVKSIAKAKSKVTIKKVVKQLAKKSAARPSAKARGEKARAASAGAQKRTISDSATLKNETSVAFEVVASAAPARAPMRKIIGRDSSIQSAEVIPIKPLGDSRINALTPKEVPQPKVVKEEAYISQPKLLWETLPYTVPAAIRFLVGAAKRECEKAAASLFSFGKFIAALPQELCGLELAFLIMRLEHSHEDVARICRIDSTKLALHLKRVSSAIEDSFGTYCPDISRKFHSQIQGSRKAAAALIEPVLIAEVVPNFQILLAELIVLTLRREVLDGIAPSEDKPSRPISIGIN